MSSSNFIRDGVDNDEIVEIIDQSSNTDINAEVERVSEFILKLRQELGRISPVPATIPTDTRMNAANRHHNRRFNGDQAAPAATLSSAANTDDDNAIVDLSSTPPSARRRRTFDSPPTIIDVVDLCSPAVQQRPVVGRSHRSRSNRRTAPEIISVNLVDSSLRAERQRPASASIGAVTTASQSRELDILDESANENVPKVSCSVCLEAALNNEPTITKCGHVFCNKCISTWVASNRTCPLCKTKLTLKSLVRMYL